MKKGIRWKLLQRFLLLALFPVLVGGVAWYQGRMLKEGLGIRSVVQEDIISPFYRTNSRIREYLALSGENGFLAGIESVDDLYVDIHKGMEHLEGFLREGEKDVLAEVKEAFGRHREIVSRLFSLRKEYRSGILLEKVKGDKIELALRNDPALYPLFLRARERGKEFMVSMDEKAAREQQQILEGLISSLNDPALRASIEEYSKVAFRNNELLRQIAALQQDLGLMTLKVDTVLQDLMRTVSERGEATSRAAETINLSAVGVCFLLAVSIALLTARRFTVPLSRLVYASREIAGGNYDVSIEVRTRDELELLADSMRKMASELKERASRERRQMEEVQRQRDIAEGQRQEAERLKSEAERRQRELLDEVNQIGAFVRATAEGDYYSFLDPERFNQLRDLAREFNEMKRQQREILLQVLEASNQVLLASSQITEASQNLAMNATNQTAAVEETTGNMEEMSVMIDHNAEKAQEANRSMQQALGRINEAVDSLQALIGAMDEIVEASDSTRRIVKNIDEIAFQTNLLALNAAIEAARAGSAGAGFAVVADEIRALAQRSAEAAQQTARLIDDMAQRVKKGRVVLEGATERFGHVDEEAKKIGQLMEEIAAASSEQARGVAEVKAALQRINEIGQQVAANAEESAAAAEQMKSQAASLTEMVNYFKLQEGPGTATA